MDGVACIRRGCLIAVAVLAACAGGPGAPSSPGAPDPSRQSSFGAGTTSFVRGAEGPGAAISTAAADRDGIDLDGIDLDGVDLDGVDRAGANPVVPAMHRAEPSASAAVAGASASRAQDGAATPAERPSPPTAPRARATAADSGSRPADPTPAPAAARAPTVSAIAARERELRERLRGDEPVAAALDLAALLCDLERHREARSMLRFVRQRGATPSPLLTVALAGVERDLGQRHVAVAELRQLRADAGAIALHPGLLFELAELEWLEGEGDRALATVREIAQLHGDDVWCRSNARELAALVTEIEEHEAPQRVAIRDLLGNLRGGGRPAVRLATLEQLVQVARDPKTRTELGALERRVLAAAVADPSGAVRARAIQLGPSETTNRPEFFAVALQDPDPLVRGVAAERAVELMQTEAAPLLLARLPVESDPATFRIIDNALRALAGQPARTGLVLPDAGDRAKTLAAWAARREELGW